MSSRIAGRLLTSPLAFLLAGVLDVVLFAGATIVRRLRRLTHRMLESAPNIARR